MGSVILPEFLRYHEIIGRTWIKVFLPSRGTFLVPLETLNGQEAIIGKEISMVVECLESWPKGLLPEWDAF